MSSIKTIAVFFASAAIAAPALTTAAFADDTVTFDFHEYELTSASGIESLYARINERAETLCAEGRDAPTVRIAECEADLVNDFIEEIDHNALSDMHAGAAGDRYASY